MSKIALVQICRNGDIVSVLPIAKHLADAGHEVTMVTHLAFAPILEAVSYVKVLPFHGLHRGVQAAAVEAQRHGFAAENIIRCQVDGNELPPSMDTGNFLLQQWTRAGYLEKFHELPLIFDNRDTAGEANAIRVHVPPEDGRPLLMANFNGHSSRYIHADAQKRWVDETFGKDWRIVHLGDITLPKPHHLIGLIEKADCLLTVDTLTLHLAYATMTPTIALSVDTPYYQSEPRAHWVYRCTYPDSIGSEARAEIKRILDERDFLPGRMMREMPKPLADKIVHVADWFLGNPKDNPRILNARKTWDKLASADPNYEICLHELKDGQRSSRDLGDTRRLPFLRDIIDCGASRCDAKDILVWTNSDVSLVPEALKEIRRKLADWPCCFSRRVEVHSNGPELKLSDLRRSSTHCGADLFAMRAGFWREHGGELPDLLLACEGFDAIVRFWMRKYAPMPEMAPPVIYHQKHDSYWAHMMRVQSNPGQVYNREECEKWVRDNGFDASLYDRHESQFLFKPDESWMGKQLATA